MAIKLIEFEYMGGLLFINPENINAIRCDKEKVKTKIFMIGDNDEAPWEVHEDPKVVIYRIQNG